MLMTAQSKPLARRFAVLIALAVIAVPTLAQAQRKSPLADAPAIRKRYELRSVRFEIGAGGGSTINQDFYHSALINVRAAFHITDWLAIAGFGSFAAANISTGFRDKVINSLNATPADKMLAREPTSTIAQDSILKINNIVGAQLEFTPFAGKYSLFGKLFAAYDSYIMLGGGLLTATATNKSALTPCSSHVKAGSASAPDPSDFQCDDSGSRPGGNVGIGVHSFFNNWLALNVELRDIIAQINPAGRDVNGDKVADKHDDVWANTFLVTANLTFFLPATPSISP